LRLSGMRSAPRVGGLGVSRPEAGGTHAWLNVLYRIGVRGDLERQ
jgi:hypothetical protein